MLLIMYLINLTITWSKHCAIFKENTATKFAIISLIYQQFKLQ